MFFPNVCGYVLALSYEIKIVVVNGHEARHILGARATYIFLCLYSACWSLWDQQEENYLPIL